MWISRFTMQNLHLIPLQGVFRMHYGMNVVLLNSLDEVLCVNQHHEVMCKTEDQLESHDEICFKIVDLTDPSNPGELLPWISSFE
jgi:hypothetical protein